MTDPRLATTFDWGRMYARTRGGQPEVPSITTVLDAMNHDMEWWEALCAVRLAMERTSELVAIEQIPDGPERWSAERKEKDFLVGAAERDRNEAAHRGDIVHNYAETFALYQMGSATRADMSSHWQKCNSAGLLSYVNHFHQFWETFNPRPIRPEMTVWSKSVGYAGTTDLVCEIDTPQGTLQTILDYKTRKALFRKNGQPKDNDLQTYTGMQLAAAVFAEEIWEEGATPSDDRWEPNPFEPEVALGVVIASDGWLVRQYDVYDPLVWSTFVALRRVWEFRRDGGRTLGSSVTGPASLRRLMPIKSTAVSAPW